MPDGAAELRISTLVGICVEIDKRDAHLCGEVVAKDPADEVPAVARTRDGRLVHVEVGELLEITHKVYEVLVRGTTPRPIDSWKKASEMHAGFACLGRVSY